VAQRFPSREHQRLQQTTAWRKPKHCSRSHWQTLWKIILRKTPLGIRCRGT